MAIGILDSGVGGLTVWKDLQVLLPGVSTIYLGDSKNCPYGTKSEAEIMRLTRILVDHLLDQGVSLIVLACNTISVTTLERLRSLYPATLFVGTVPAVKSAVAESKQKRIGILSTPRTAASEYQKQLIHEFASDCQILNIGTDALVPLVERGEIEGESVLRVVREVLQPFLDARIDTLVLGCTHFPFLKSVMQRVLGDDVVILDSGAAIARQVKRLLEGRSLLTSEGIARHQFFTTGDPEQMSQLLRLLGVSTQSFAKQVIL